MLFFFQMGKDQSLPVQIQIVGTAEGIEHQTTAPGTGFQQQMDLRIMAQRFKMAYAFHRLSDGFLIDDTSLSEGYVKGKSLANLPLKHLQLHLAHKLHLYFPQAFVPKDVQLRVFLLQLTQFTHGFGQITILRQQHPIGQHRFQQRCLRLRFAPQTLPREGALKTGNSTHRAGFYHLGLFVFGARIQPQLIGHFRPFTPVVRAGKQALYPQLPTGDLQIGQTGALRIPGDLVDPRAKLRRIRRC